MCCSCNDIVKKMTVKNRQDKAWWSSPNVRGFVAECCSTVTNLPMTLEWIIRKRWNETWLRKDDIIFVRNKMNRNLSRNGIVLWKDTLFSFRAPSLKPGDSDDPCFYSWRKSLLLLLLFILLFIPPLMDFGYDTLIHRRIVRFLCPSLHILCPSVRLMLSYTPYSLLYSFRPSFKCS